MKIDKKIKSRRARYKWGNALYRISIFRSSKHIYVQVTEIQTGKTLFSTSDLNLKTKGNIKKAEEIGRKIGQKITQKKLKDLVFDRGTYKYHGRVKAVAEGIREEGVKI